MVVIGCPLNEAYNMNKKKKKVKEEDNGDDKKANTEIMDDFFKVTGLQGYVDDDNFNRNISEKKAEPTVTNIPEKKPVELDIKEETIHHNYERQNKIAVDYDEYINYEIYKRNMTNNKSEPVIEAFGNIKDDFNEVLLFALLGIFFIIFTDYIYKLGKKSY
jgi:hypothetical protein